MFPSLSEDVSSTVSSGNRIQDLSCFNPIHASPKRQQHKNKKKRSLPGNPDPDAEVIALSPRTLLATNRFVCEICDKGFQRDQNLQLHRRGHNLPWKLKQRNSKDQTKKRAYVCPEPTCVHHDPSRALGDLTGIKKHYSRKHGEKKWKCEKCSKIYAVHSDWKAHSKTCGTREYTCDCGTLFSRKDSFITHRAFCDALAEECARVSAHRLVSSNPTAQSTLLHHNPQSQSSDLFHNQITLDPWNPQQNPSNNNKNQQNPHFQLPINPLLHPTHITSSSAPGFQALPSGTTSASSSCLRSATALLQKAASVGATTQSVVCQSQMSQLDLGTLTQPSDISHHYHQGGNYPDSLASDRLTRDFLGLTHDHHGDNGNGGIHVSINVRELLTYAGGVGLQQFSERPLGFGFSQNWGDC